MPYALSQRAYVTLLLHALKHPASTVSGVVLGPAQRSADAGGSPPGSPRASAPRQLTLTVPLFHTQPALSPMLEVALAQVEAYAAANGLAIVAYYAANERPDDTDLSPAARRIADKIAAVCPGACALLVRTRRNVCALPPLPPLTRTARRRWTLLSLLRWGARRRRLRSRHGGRLRSGCGCVGLQPPADASPRAPAPQLLTRDAASGSWRAAAPGSGERRVPRGGARRRRFVD